MESYYIKIDGGIGRCIAATGAVIKFAQNHPTSIVTSFPYVFEGINELERVYPIGTPYIYEDKISKGIYLEPEPYNDVNYYREKKHLSTVFNILLNGCDEYVHPKIFLTPNELAGGKMFVENAKQQGIENLVLFQPFGSSGGKPLCKEEEKCSIDESFRSLDYLFAKKICEKLNENKLTPFVIKNPEQAGFVASKTFSNPVSPRAIFATIPYVSGIICCDSFLHHASAALKSPVPTIVLWAGTSKENLGYNDHVNLISEKQSLIEPNRIPHDHSFYVTKNKGVNEFDDIYIDKIIKEIK